jgi:hypothetical protein
MQIKKLASAFAVFVFFQGQLNAQDQPSCDTTVYVYVDVSASLDPGQKDKLSSVVHKVLTVPGPMPVTINQEVRLVPFAGKAGNPESGKNLDVKSAIRGVLNHEPPWTEERLKDLNFKQSNLVAVFEDIAKRLQSDQINGAYPVFVVASDFLHDSSDSDDPESRGHDLRDWIDYAKSKNFESLKQRFSSCPASEPCPILLLFPVQPRRQGPERLDVSSQVLTDLKQLVAYNNQIFEINGGITHPSVLEFIRPLALTVKREGDGRVLKVKVVNRACSHLPDLELVANRSDGTVLTKAPYPRCRFDTDKVNSCELSVDLGNPQVWDEGKDVKLFLQKPGTSPDPIQEQRIAVEEFLSVSSVEAHFGRFNRYLDSTVRGRYLLWQNDRAPLSMTLLDHMRTIGTSGEINLHRKQQSEDLRPQPFSERTEIAVQDEIQDLARICLSGRGERLQLTFTVRPEDLLIEKGPHDVWVIPHDGQGDLLQDVVQHGSFPALATLLTLLALSVRRRELSLGHIEEILGVAGFWLIVFFLLHRVESFARAIDIFFVGDLGRWLALSVALALTAVGVVMLWQGVLSPARSEAEIALSLAREEHGLSPKRRSGLVRRTIYGYARLLLLVVVPLGAGIWIFFGEPSADCTFTVLPEAPAHEIVSPPPTTPGEPQS